MASRRVIEFEIVLYICTPSGGERRSLFTVHKTYVEDLGRNAVKETRNVEKCEHRALLVMILTERLMSSADVPHGDLHADWRETPLRIIDSRVGFEMLMKHNLLR